MTEKPIAIVLPNWNDDDPRFIVTDCEKCSDDRVFKNGKCVYNQRLCFCYSVDEIVEVLNNDRLEKENEQLKQEKQHLHQAMSREEVRHQQFKSKVFELIDEKIENAENGVGMTYDSWYVGQVDILKELKEELLDD